MVSKPGSARLAALPLPRCATAGARVLAVGAIGAGALSSAAAGALAPGPSAGAALGAAGAPSAVCARNTPGARTTAPMSAPAKRWNGMLESRARRVQRLQFWAKSAPAQPPAALDIDGGFSQACGAPRG